MRLTYALISLLSLSLGAKADCLSELRDIAKSQRSCLVTQTGAADCDSQVKATNDKVQQCRTKGFAPSQTTYAIQEGFQQVAGDPANSPYQLGLRHDNAHHQLLDEHRLRWMRHFDQVIPEAKVDGFDTSHCPLSFDGHGNRYMLVTTLPLTVRETLGIELGNSHDDVTHIFLTQMRDGKCYGAHNEMQTTRIEPDQQDFVYNLSDGDINLIKQSDLGQTSSPFLIGHIHTHLCSEIDTCLAEKNALDAQWQDYKNAVHHMVEDEACLNYADANASGEINLKQLFKHDCNPAEARRHIAKHQDTIKVLDTVLF